MLSCRQSAAPGVQARSDSVSVSSSSLSIVTTICGSGLKQKVSMDEYSKREHRFRLLVGFEDDCSIVVVGRLVLSRIDAQVHDSI